MKPQRILSKFMNGSFVTVTLYQDGVLFPTIRKIFNWIKDKIC